MTAIIIINVPVWLHLREGFVFVFCFVMSQKIESSIPILVNFEFYA